MGRLAEVLEYYVEDADGRSIGRVKCAFTPKDVVTADHYSAVGEEENPLPGDFAFLVEDEDTGRWVAIRFFDPKWVRRGARGEVVRYSRDGSGNAKAIWHLKADGSIDLNDGKAKVSSGGVLTCDDALAGQISLKSHGHVATTTATVSDGPPPVVGTVTVTTPKP